MQCIKNENHKKTIKDIKSFTIKRSLWARGKNKPDVNALLNEDATMCCLGFYSKACGASSNSMLNVTSPYRFINVKNKAWLANLNNSNLEIINFKSKLIIKSDNDDDLSAVNSFVAGDLINYNDDELLSEKEREKAIKNSFAEIGVKVRFVD